MADLVSVIAEVLAEHGAVIKWGSDMTYCECGVPKGGFEFTTDHNRHVAGVVAGAIVKQEATK